MGCEHHQQTRGETEAGAETHTGAHQAHGRKAQRQVHIIVKPRQKWGRLTRFYPEVLFPVSNVCFSCQYTAFGRGSKAQQLETDQAKYPQVTEEAEGRCTRMAGMGEALEEWHPLDRGWEERTPFTASAANLSEMMECEPNSPPTFFQQGCLAQGSSLTSPSCASWLCLTWSSSCSCSASSCCPSLLPHTSQEISATILMMVRRLLFFQFGSLHSTLLMLLEAFPFYFSFQLWIK